MVTCMLAVIDVVAVSPVREMAPGSSWHRNTKEDKNRRLPDFDCHVRLRFSDVVWPVRRHWHGATRTRAMTHIAI